MAINASELPPELRAAQAELAGCDGLYFAPVRHHSPACTLALRHLLREVQPSVVLVEGPDDLDHLLPLLQDERTRAPVAWLCQSRQTTEPAPVADEAADDEADAADADAVADEAEGREMRTSFFPFCDYSPEWLAIREGAALGAQVALIDLPWAHKAWQAEHDDAGLSLMHERHYAHSRYLKAMAGRLGCVDHHELWDRLFELRSPAALADWREFFADVFAWSAMARQDYEPEVLEAELSLPRERQMAAHIRAWREKCTGNIVVVTGGFHTQELISSWRQAGRPEKLPASAAADGGAWLIRYSFASLDALNGYSAGMPSPAYYQQLWDALQTTDDYPWQRIAVDLLSRFARQQRAADQADAASTALVQEAVLQATRLAHLRGNPGPGRQDVLDAIRSCFIKGADDDGTRGMLAELRHFLAGTRLGDIPPGAGSPPLVEDARRRARALGLRFDDSVPRKVRLDLYRKPAHRLRSRFFQAMRYLECPLVRHLSGPDFYGNAQLHLLFEEWEVAWSPLVEARLIELSSSGASVEALCLKRLEDDARALEAAGAARSASAAVALLLRACLIGLHGRLPRLFELLSTQLDEDASLASVIDCGHRLLTLWRAREPLGVQGHPLLASLLDRVWPAAMFLLAEITCGDEDAESERIGQLLSLRELGQLLARTEGGEQRNGAAHTPRVLPSGRGQPEKLTDFAIFHARLSALLGDPATAPGIRGAAVAMLFLDGLGDEALLDQQLLLHFSPGVPEHHAVRFLGGLMQAAPELVLRLPSLLQRLDALIADWETEDFVAHLPDLRFAFTRLKPQESARLAETVVAFHGYGPAEAAALQPWHTEVSEAEMLQGSRLQHVLVQELQRDGLDAWG